MTMTDEAEALQQFYHDESLDRLGDREWRLNNLYYIIDATGNRVLFQPNNIQNQLNNNLWYLNLILKSRQHGITTDICILYLDYCLFTPNIRAGIIAHTRDDAEIFFNDKIKYAYDNLPDRVKKDMVPADSRSARELSFGNNSAIRVGTSLRGSTLQLLHISEFGKICAKYPDKAKEIVTGSLNTVHSGQIITIESTAEGKSGYFYDYCTEAHKTIVRGGRLAPLEWRLFFFPWYKDAKNTVNCAGVTIPEAMATYFRTVEAGERIELTSEQKAWYYLKWKIQGSDMKREYPSTFDEAFEASLQGAYFAHQFERIYREGRITNLSYEEGYPVHTFWDLGMNDTTDIWFAQKVLNQWRIIDFYENEGEGLSHYAQVLRSKEYEYGNHYAPHDIEVRELGTGKTRKEQAEAYGISFCVAPKLAKADQIEAARNILQHCWFDEARCNDGINGLEAYRKVWDDRNGCYKNDPLHDWASNPADAFEVFAVVSSDIGRKSNSGFVPRRSR
jgi:hypothetical protein